MYDYMIRMSQIKKEIHRLEDMLCIAINDDTEQLLMEKIIKLKFDLESEYQKAHGNYDEWIMMQRYI